MPLVLVRVDERLLHGQVVIGWGHELRPGRYVVADDDLARSAWEQDLYRLAASDTDVLFVDIEEARRRLDEWRGDPARTIVLLRDIGSLRRLSEGGTLMDEEVNLGGVHHAPGRRELLPYLYASDGDLDDLRTVAGSGAHVSARDLPDSTRVPLAALLED